MRPPGSWTPEGKAIGSQTAAKPDRPETGEAPTDQRQSRPKSAAGGIAIKFTVDAGRVTADEAGKGQTDCWDAE